MEAVQPLERVQPTEPVQPVQPTEPVEPVQPVEPVEPGGNAKNVSQKRKPVSNSKRAGITFPVGRIHRLLKKKYTGPVTQTAAVYMAGVLEYLTRELSDVASEAARTDDRKCISARSIYLGIRNDSELTRLYDNLGMVIPGSGVVPQTLAPGQKKNKKAKSESISEEQVATPAVV